MSLLLAIHSYPGANETVKRHLPFYKASGADEIIGIGTTCGGCKWPKGMTEIRIGVSRYIMGDHLPKRLINTIAFCLGASQHTHFAIIEYDVIFAKPLPIIPGFHGILAGGRLNGSKAPQFFHSPWCFDRETGEKIMAAGRNILTSETIDGHERSPDVFLGWCLDVAGIEPNLTAWRGFTQNRFDRTEMLDEARDKWKAGELTAVHGVKHERELHHITA